MAQFPVQQGCSGSSGGVAPPSSYERSRCQVCQLQPTASGSSGLRRLQSRAKGRFGSGASCQRAFARSSSCDELRWGWASSTQLRLARCNGAGAELRASLCDPLLPCWMHGYCRSQLRRQTSNFNHGQAAVVVVKQPFPYKRFRMQILILWEMLQVCLTKTQSAMHETIIVGPMRGSVP